jgi:hypothetical protein
LIAEKIGANTEAVLEEVRRTGALPRTAAVSLATERVRRAMQTRRWMHRRDKLRWINVPPVLMARIGAFPFH